MADFVVGVGPKLGKVVHKYVPCVCKRHQDVFVFTPGVFDDFSTFNKFLKRERSAVFRLWTC